MYSHGPDIISDKGVASNAFAASTGAISVAMEHKAS